MFFRCSKFFLRLKKKSFYYKLDICINLNIIRTDLFEIYCVKSVRIRRFSGSYFPAFGLNMERYSVSLRIHSEYEKIRSRKSFFWESANFANIFSMNLANKWNTFHVLNFFFGAKSISMIFLMFYETDFGTLLRSCGFSW